MADSTTSGLSVIDSVKMAWKDTSTYPCPGLKKVHICLLVFSFDYVFNSIYFQDVLNVILANEYGFMDFQMFCRLAGRYQLY